VLVTTRCWKAVRRTMSAEGWKLFTLDVSQGARLCRKTLLAA
jgi:hypothetical protein